MTDKGDGEKDMEVEELTLDDLKVEERKQRKGGLRGGGLGPEGSRYTPPEGPRRATWKPLVAAMMLFAAGVFGTILVGSQATLESRVEGETFTLQGEVMHLKDAQDNKDTYLANVTVTLEGSDQVSVSDSDGRFELEDVPGGKIKLYFDKVEWDEYIDTTYITAIFGDFDEDQRYKFYVEAKDLDTREGRPETDVDPYLRAEVLDWPTRDRVMLRFHAWSFDKDLSGYQVWVREEGDDYSETDRFAYANELEYTFDNVATSDFSRLYLKVTDGEGAEYVPETVLDIPAHPAGDGGWESVDHPDVGLFIRGGNVTNGTSRTIAVHSNGAVNYTYRVDEGQWRPMAPMTDGHAELEWGEGAPLGPHLIEFVTQNATGVNGTSEQVLLSIDTIAPTLDPDNSIRKAVTNEAPFEIQAKGADFMRYAIPGGGWSPWQLYAEEVIVPVEYDLVDDGAELTTSFQVMDRAGNTEIEAGSIEAQKEDPYVYDEYELYKSTERICLPIMVIGILLSFIGGWMAYKRQRPTLAMAGAIGALLAGGFHIVGAILAIVALALITLSREEFELPGTEPPDNPKEV